MSTKESKIPIGGKRLCISPGFLNPNSVCVKSFCVVFVKVCGRKKELKLVLFFRQEKEKKSGMGCGAFVGPVSNEWNISLFTSVQESSASVKAGR